MGRRKGNSLQQRAQRAQQRAVVVAVAKAAAEAKATEEAKAYEIAWAKQQDETREFIQKLNILLEQEKATYAANPSNFQGVVIDLPEEMIPHVKIVCHSYPSGSTYKKAEWTWAASRQGFPKLQNHYRGGVDLGNYFFSGNLWKVSL